jgi:hypothetical protein
MGHPIRTTYSIQRGRRAGWSGHRQVAQRVLTQSANRTSKSATKVLLFVYSADIVISGGELLQFSREKRSRFCRSLSAIVMPASWKRGRQLAELVMGNTPRTTNMASESYDTEGLADGRAKSKHAYLDANAYRRMLAVEVGRHSVSTLRRAQRSCVLIPDPPPSGNSPLPSEDDGTPADGPSPEELRRAMKAFRKRLKLTRLDAESGLGHGATSGGRHSGIISITPPHQYPKAVWDELVRQGRLKYVGQGLYEPADT